MRRFAVITAAFVLAVATLPLQAAAAPVTISIACGALGVELRLCQEGVAAWEKKTGNHVRIVTTPNSSTDRLALYLQMLASHTSDIDVLQIDVVWAGILASQLVDLSPYVGDAPKADFPTLIENDTVDGKLVAMPWWADVGVLYYRKDLLTRYGFAPPQTWHELTNDAEAIERGERQAGHRRLWGFVFQGRAYEGLTCDALEWIASFGGGTIIDKSGAVTVDNPRAIAALRMAAGWVGTIAPRGVLNYDEEAARGVFQTGNAVFMRNWPYAWALSQSKDSAVRGKVGVSVLPRGPDGETAGTLGGWQLAISRYSKHPAQAASLVVFLTSAEQQKKRAIAASYNPTIEKLYADPQVLAANPFFKQLVGPLEAAVARPARIVGPYYNHVSNDFWRAAHDILAGEAAPASRVAVLAQELNRLKHRARW
jgi:trehalose/maltose transport system substrate-binding protein